MGKKIEFTVDREVRAVVFLSSVVPGLTRAKADLLVKSGEVRVNGAKIKKNAELLAGDMLTVFVPDEFGRDKNVKVLYEDSNIVVFDKPKRTPYDALPSMYGEPLLAAHRLDTNTTGVIVFARTERALGELTSAFRERRASKIYEAVVYPAPAKDREVLTAYTKLDHNTNYAFVFSEPKTGYKTMVTEYVVLRRINGAALLSITPHTGRSHQIRAHLCFAGYPIIGEHKYGAKDAKKFDGAPDTQMLAAVELEFSGLENGLGYLNGRCFKTESGFDLSFLSDASNE